MAAQPLSWTNGFGQFDHIGLLGKLRSKTVELGRNAAKCDGKQIRGNRVIRSKLSPYIRQRSEQGQTRFWLRTRSCGGDGAAHSAGRTRAELSSSQAGPAAPPGAPSRVPTSSNVLVTPQNHRRGSSLPRLAHPRSCTYPVRWTAEGSAEADPPSPAGLPNCHPITGKAPGARGRAGHDAARGKAGTEWPAQHQHVSWRDKGWGRWTRASQLSIICVISWVPPFPAVLWKEAARRVRQVKQSAWCVLNVPKIHGCNGAYWVFGQGAIKFQEPSPD